MKDLEGIIGVVRDKKRLWWRGERVRGRLSILRFFLFTEGKELRVLVVGGGSEFCKFRLVRNFLCLYIVF